MAPGAYLWWYIDALSDDGRHALTLIAFVGSVFSPYYARALRRDPATPADQHCAMNVSLYGGGARRWTMTERGARQVRRSAGEFSLGPSSLAWTGAALVAKIDEIGAPLGRRVRGSVRVWPESLTSFGTALDEAGRHRWGPIAPCARIDVRLDEPALRWSGSAYVDCNEGDEPIDRPFIGWDWSRGELADGSVAVIYDVRPRQGPARLVAQRFALDGSSEPFEPGPRHELPATRLWRIGRGMRSDGAPAAVVDTLEDTPFYSRSLVRANLLGETVTSVHESLDVPRWAATATQWMLPWRMPRRP